MQRVRVSREALRRRLQAVRARSVAIADDIPYEAQLVQAFADASPTKWHLGHTTWFFDRLVLARAQTEHLVDPHLEYVFNSYYEAIGARQPRQLRSHVVDPSLGEVRAYRARVDEQLESVIENCSEEAWSALASVLELGTHHEEQHQELMLTDIKPVLAALRAGKSIAALGAQQPSSDFDTTWHAHAGGLVEIGWEPAQGFAFDNETPRHRVWLEPFEIAARPVTNREYLAFIDAGSYGNAALWLSDGWDAVRSNDWSAPMYWRRGANGWEEFELGGWSPLELERPVRHVSYYEADAYARWAGARLPTEAEWEHACAMENRRLPGEVWEWTASSYLPYPRFRPFDGALAEYNGKFMCGQMVLRGGSRFTPEAHLRVTYRNFFHPPTRWQMAGIRLARWSET